MMLTKSRFKVAVECPRKLVYGADARYASDFEDNEFLNALADGGHQVGALAKLLYPEGVEITSDPDRQVSDTLAAVAAPSVILFEPTFQYQSLLVRVDVLIKRDNAVSLIEVKSKSLKPGMGFRGKRGDIASAWRPYLEDVAFQYYVLSRAMPAWEITPFLLLIDPTAQCSTDSLGARISVNRSKRRVAVTLDSALTFADIQPPLQARYNVGAEVREILAGPLQLNGVDLGFAEFVDRISGKLESGEDFEPWPSAACKVCEFYCDPGKRSEAHRSGWAECMSLYTHQPMEARRSDTVFGLYAERNTAQWIHPARLHLRDLTIDVDEEEDSISASHRHALQVQEAQGRLEGPVIRHRSLRAAFEAW
jgi:hypothetical protein